MSLYPLLLIGVVFAGAGILVQGFHSRLLLEDLKLHLERGGPQLATPLIELRIGIAAILASIHLLVASTGVVHLLTNTPLCPAAADYYAAIVRIVVSMLVISSTALSLRVRQRLLAS